MAFENRTSTVALITNAYTFVMGIRIYNGLTLTEIPFDKVPDLTGT